MQILWTSLCVSTGVLYVYGVLYGIEDIFIINNMHNAATSGALHSNCDPRKLQMCFAANHAEVKLHISETDLLLQFVIEFTIIGVVRYERSPSDHRAMSDHRER